MMNLLMIWLAFSVRTPNIEQNPFDYEVSAGYETKVSFIKSEAKILFERENGNQYSGRNHNHDLKYLIIGEYVRTAKEISQQKVIVKYPIKARPGTFEYMLFGGWTLNLGVASLWNDYQDRRTTLYGNIRAKYLDFEIAGYEKIELIKGRLKYTINVTDHIFIEPNASLFYAEKYDYSAKIKLGFKL